MILLFLSRSHARYFSLAECFDQATALHSSIHQVNSKACLTVEADVRAQSSSYGGEKGGEMTVDAGGQHVLERTSVLINSKVCPPQKQSSTLFNFAGGGVEAYRDK